MITKIIADATNKKSKYTGTSVEAWSNAHPVTSGVTIGEAVAEHIMTERGMRVEPRQSTTHDRVVNGKKTEIKTAFQAEDKESYTFYGYDPTDDPHQWLFQFVAPDEEITLVTMDRVAMSHMYLRESKGAFMLNTTIDEMVLSGGKIIATYFADLERKENGNYKTSEGTIFAARDEIGEAYGWNWVKDAVFGGGFNTFKEAYKNLKGMA